MWLPAKVEDYRFYFTLDELMILFEEGPSLREKMTEWIQDPEIVVRLYYKPGKNIWQPVMAYHLDDVLRLTGALGLKITPEWRDEVMAARESLPDPSTVREFKGL